MLSYKQWNQLTIFCFFLSGIFLFTGIKNTVIDYKELRQNENLVNSGIEQDIILSDNSESDILSEEDCLNSSDLIDIISTECKNSKVILKKLPNTKTFEHSGFSLSESTVYLKGEFKNIVKFLHKIESEKEIGSIVSTEFFLEKRNNKKAPVLNASVKIINACKIKT